MTEHGASSVDARRPARQVREERRRDAVEATHAVTVSPRRPASRVPAAAVTRGGWRIARVYPAAPHRGVRVRAWARRAAGETKLRCGIVGQNEHGTCPCSTAGRQSDLTPRPCAISYWTMGRWPQVGSS